jgi:hypothetical protein
MIFKERYCLKKIITSLALISCLGIGGVLVSGSFGEGEIKTTSKNEVVQTNTEAPIERTIELAAGAEYPWEGALVDEIDGWLNDGETVYLISDLTAFEEVLPKMIDIDIVQNKGDVEIFKRSIEQVNTQLSQYGLEEYFNKLSEAVDLVVAGNYEEAKVKIEEAKQLRTQE